MQQSTMNWTFGRERPPAGPQVNTQFTVANQMFVIVNLLTVIENSIYCGRRHSRLPLVSEKGTRG